MAVKMLVATLIPDSDSTCSLQGNFEDHAEINQHQLLLSHCFYQNVGCLFKLFIHDDYFKIFFQNYCIYRTP